MKKILPISKQINVSYVFLILLITLLFSCKKDWLDVKRNQSDVVPKSIKDFQAILDNTDYMNVTPGLSSTGNDNFYYDYTDWLALSLISKNSYVWSSDIFSGQGDLDWSTTYTTIEWSNIVLEGLEKIDLSTVSLTDYNNIKGQALFFRAKSFLELASLFAKPYTSSSSGDDLGIPVRLSSDVNVRSTRTTVQQTYQQIIDDLKSAENLVPITPLYRTRPSKVAVQALLARVYLNMEDYQNAGQYANLALSNYNTVIDYNTLPTTTYPFPVYPNNKEIIFWSKALSYGFLYGSTSSVIDSNLYNSYDINDLRKTKFYISNGSKIQFQGTYLGTTGYLFSGLATDELFLIRAECYARTGNVSSAMNDLNALMQKRWKSSVTFPGFSATDANDALRKILTERRKELPFTEPIRWDDLRRLNKDPQFAKTLTRNLNGTIYTLPPNDNKYVYPIPQDEIKLSGIIQNPR